MLDRGITPAAWTACRTERRLVHEVKASLFRVSGRPALVRILELLREGERSGGALPEALGPD